MADAIRRNVRSFLQIEPADSTSFYIKESLDFESTIFKNRIWYRGDAEELSQFYKNIGNEATNGSRFWAAVPSIGMDIRKAHTGLPSIIIDTLTSVVMSDMNDITVNEKYKENWETIQKENNFSELLEQAVKDVLVDGDGAFKITIDTNISQYPILEFVTGEYVEYTYTRGRLREIVFKTPYVHNSNRFVLYETYGYGYIRSELRKGNQVIGLNSIPQTEKLQEEITFSNSFMMAKKFVVYESNKWRGRGKSIIDNKADAFDALDECWSQWIEALRLGRAKEYIPTTMLPRNPKTGEVMRPNAFDNAYIEREKGMNENDVQKIDVVQPTIPHESYLATYVTALDQCLQGIISPSTLGIDTKKLDNAEAQREKEKTTLYTRNKIVSKIQDIIPEVIDSLFKSYFEMVKQPLEDIEAEIPFGEYANPSFESQVETVSKGKSGGVMSIEASVEELYGDSKDEEWKKEEVKRLKQEQGIAELEEPAVNTEQNTTEGKL